MIFVYFHWFGSNDRRRTFFRFPFDVKNPCGYSIAVALQFIFSFNLDLAVACISIIVIALSLVLISTVDDMMYGLNMLNTSAKRHESHFKITQQFSQFVQFNSKGKQLSEPKFQCHWNWYISILAVSPSLCGCRLADHFSELVQFLFMVLFAWSIGSMCLIMFAIKIELVQWIFP